MQFIEVSQTEFNQAKLIASSLTNDAKIRRKDHSELKHSFLKIGGKLYCIARENLGAGAFGKCKVLQDEEGRQFVVKIGYVSQEEMTLLQKSGQFCGFFDRDTKQRDGLTIRNIKNFQREYYGRDFGEHRKRYVVIPLFEGSDLRSFLDQQNESEQRWLRIGRPAPLNEKNRLMVALGIAKAVRKLHNSSPQIIHRDLKPENIMVNVINGEVVAVDCIDFGLAQSHNPTISDTGYDDAIFGSYFSPEIFLNLIIKTVADYERTAKKERKKISINLDLIRDISDSLIQREIIEKWDISFFDDTSNKRLSRLKNDILALFNNDKLLELKNEMFKHRYFHSPSTDVYGFAGIMDDLEISDLLMQDDILKKMFAANPKERCSMDDIVKKLSELLHKNHGEEFNSNGEVELKSEKATSMAEDVKPLYAKVLSAVTDYNAHFTKMGTSLFGQLRHDKLGVQRGLDLLKNLETCQNLSEAEKVIKNFLEASEGGNRPHSLKTLVRKHLEVGQKSREPITPRCK